MKYKIDPTVDCVFKALLGSEQNKKLLVHFLNAVMYPVENIRIISVELLNPYNEMEFLDDKLSVVDIKARDEIGRIFQIEIQMIVYNALDKRISYTWSDIYSSQLHKGNDYSSLKPVVSIWILCEDLFKNVNCFHHHFQMYDPNNKISLNQDCSIHILELEKFVTNNVHNELERWLLFFKEGEELDDTYLPEYMNTEEMREAMNTLKAFSEKERAYHLYQSRLNYIREQKTIQLELEAQRQEIKSSQKEIKKAQKEKEKVEKEKEKAEKEKEKAEKEKEKAEKEKEKAEKEKEKAEKEKEKAEKEKEKAEKEKEKAEKEKEKAFQSLESKEQLLTAERAEKEKLLEIIKELQNANKQL
ncbi:MAG: Rpn family recombination-promoting nuclease/putative transposase [Desulfobacterales bacterium]|nr:Rpn family recombination-promoting nuclease/putative transposase [Desulfobacterales bacterium]